MRRTNNTDSSDFYETPAGAAWHGAGILSCHLVDGSPVLDAGCGRGVLGKAVQDHLNASKARVHFLDAVAREGQPEGTKICAISDLKTSYQAMITDPPYNDWRRFVTECVYRASYVLALGPLTLLDTESSFPPGLRRVYATALPESLGQENQAMAGHAWFLFVRGFEGLPEIAFLGPYMREKIRCRDRAQELSESTCKVHAPPPKLALD